MARWKKRLGRMRDNPRGWRYEQIATILERCGFEPPQKPKGSHRTFVHSSGRRVQLVDAGKGHIKPVYVEEAIRALDDVGCP